VFLDRQPLWRDEAFTAVVVQRPLGSMLDAVSRDSAPPLQYLLEHLVAMVSASPWALRLPSLVASVALIPIAALLARRAAGERAALATALVVAVLPATVISARDARMYALAATLCCTAVLLLWRLVERPTWVRAVAYGAVAALAAWTQYFSLVALVASGLAAAWWLRPSRRALLAAAAATAIAVATLAPWLLAARAQFSHAATPFWVEPVGLKTIAGTAVQFFSGPPIDPGVPAKIPLQVLQGLAVTAGGLLLVVLVMRRRKLDAGAHRGTAFLAATGLIGIGLLVLLSLWHPLLEARYASVLWTPLLAVCGIGLTLIPGRPLVVAALVALAVPSAVLSAAVTHPQTADVLPGPLGEHDVLLADPSQYLLVEYYGGDSVRRRAHVIGDDVPWFWGTAAFPEGAVLTSVPPDVTANHGTIYWVGEPEDVPPAGYRETEVRSAIRVRLEVLAPG
jgi:4-amino-4-deoxy-L-arabinose transferase-like glycosyltransferase